VIIVTWIVAIVIVATFMMVVLAVVVPFVTIIVGGIVVFVAGASQGGLIVEARDDPRAISAELEQVPCFLERARCREGSLRFALEVRQELTERC
jgi:K+-transporting ATPase c subunit